MYGVLGNEILTDDDYRAYLNKKKPVYAVLFLAGIITILITQLAQFVWKVELMDYMHGFYTGIGVGLLVIAIFLYARNRRTLGSPERLRKERIKNTDERNLKIGQKSRMIALAALLVGIYVAMLIGGLWYPILTKVLAGLVYLFLISYCIAYKVLSGRM
ncbi:MAG: hypothetical protein PHS74_11475 [Lachnospiraceae bacterium]|nr:hypothetical protein [Lachnospiraceae bacterium]